MKSKTSLFNWTLFKKDIFRVWPFWVLQLVIFQMLSSVKIFSSYLYFKQKLTMGLTANYMASMQMRMLTFVCGALYSTIIAIICIVSAVLVFSYLNKRVESYMIHSFPITRQSLFVTHGLAGFAMALGPILLTFVVVFLENAVMQTNMGEVLIQYMLQTAVMVIFFYALACLVVMVSGHSFMSIVIYTVSNFLVYGLEKLFYFTRLFYSVDNVSYYSMMDFSVSDLSLPFTPVLSFLKLGYRTRDLAWTWTDTIARQLLEGAVYWYGNDDFISVNANWKNFGLSCFYLIPAVIFIGLALLLYKKRPLEYVGNNLAFKWCKYVFLWIFSMFGSLILLTFLGVVGKQSFFAHLTYRQIMIVASLLVGVFSLVFYIVGDMILSKDFHKWTRISWKWALALSASLACFFAGMNFFYESSSVPDTARVSYVTVSLGDNNYAFEDSAVIERLGQFQKDFIAEFGHRTPEMGQETGSNVEFEIEYTLKSGRHIKRSYSVLYNSYVDILSRLGDFLNANVRSFTQLMKPIADIGPLMCTDITINYYGEDGVYMDSYSAYPNNIRNELYVAMAEDLREGHLYVETFGLYGDSSIIQNSDLIGAAFVSFRADDVKQDVMSICYVWITKDARHTIEVMKKYDIYDYHDIINQSQSEDSAELMDSGRWHVTE